MSVRHRRRSVHAEAIAPWAALSFILLLWWAGAKTIDTIRPFVPKTNPVDTAPPAPVLTAREAGPRITANTIVRGSDVELLRRRLLALPVRGVEAKDLMSSFDDARGQRKHEAIDILAPRGTDVLAVEDGRVAKLFTSVAGGLTVYQFDPSEQFVYYYAHLDSYAPGLKEGMMLRKGDVVGAVGTTGNAPEGTPHLHFAISKLDPDRKWWGGTALDPYLVWHDPARD